MFVDVVLDERMAALGEDTRELEDEDEDEAATALLNCFDSI